MDNPNRSRFFIFAAIYMFITIGYLISLVVTKKRTLPRVLCYVTAMLGYVATTVLFLLNYIGMINEAASMID